ncbi:MAG: hypothetical protein U0414_21220 [Polyangiaceae bacterium]
MRRTAFAVGSAVVLLAFAGSAAVSACSSNDLADVVFEGGTTSDALEGLIEAKLVDSPPDAAEFTWPSNGDIVELTPPPTFCWQQGPMQARLEEAPPTPFAAPRATARTASRDRSSWFDRWFGERAAYADTKPLAGRGFLVVFSSATEPELVRVFTTTTEYTPDAAHLAKLTSAKGTLKAVVTTAMFADDSVTTTGGPFQGVPVTFTMASAATQ